MLFEDRNKYFIVFSVLFLVAYFFAATKKIEQGVYFKPERVSLVEESAESLDDETTENLSGKTVYPFILGENFGYFSDDGIILQNKKIENRISISNSFWASYNEKPARTEIFSCGEDEQASFVIDESGFVHFDDDRIYLFEPTGCSVSKFDANGKKIWHYTHCAAITAFNSSKKATIIGYSDGRLACISNEGKPLFDFYPGGSNFQVIMGAAVSDDGKKAICICGLQEQRMLLIAITESHHKIVHHSSFKADLRKQVFADFDSQSKFAVFESADGIGVIDCKSYETSFIKEKGEIVGLGKKMQNSVLTILIQNENENTLYAISPPNLIIGKTKFKAKDSFLIQDGNKIFLGSDNKILKLKMEGLK